MKFLYEGRRKIDDEFDLTVSVNILNESNELRGKVPLVQVVRHSPAGIEWGYEGSGPADLALSILVDYGVRVGKVKTSNEAIKKVNGVYMDFKRNVIAKLGRFEWEIKSKTVEEYWKVMEISEEKDKE